MAIGRVAAELEGESPLTALGHDLGRSRRRERRLWRSYQGIDEKRDPIASAAAHQAWSGTVDDALKIADATSRAQASDLGELLLQFEAIWWWMVEDDNVVDGSTRRWLHRFRRSLRRLAARN